MDKFKNHSAIFFNRRVLPKKSIDKCITFSYLFSTLEFRSMGIRCIIRITSLIPTESVVHALQTVCRLPAHETRGHYTRTPGILWSFRRNIRRVHPETLPWFWVRDLSRRQRCRESPGTDPSSSALYTQYHSRGPERCAPSSESSRGSVTRGRHGELWIRIRVSVLQSSASTTAGNVLQLRDASTADSIRVHRKGIHPGPAATIRIQLWHRTSSGVGSC